MNRILTEEDGAELYGALGCAHATNLQLRIGYDGEKLVKGEVNLNKSEAQTIYRAMMSTRENILRGAYDTYPDESKTSGSVTYVLLEQVGRILDKIGFLGENLMAASYMSLKRA